MSKNITIRDIAAEAGVSVSTVSRVINKKSRVSDEARAKVLRIIEDSGYHPSNIAVSMITKRSDIIVVLVPNIVTNFYARVVNGVEQTVRRAGYSTLIFSTMDKPHGEREFLEGRFSKMVDGIIAIPSTEDADPYREFDKPVIFVDRFLDVEGRDSVTIDNYRGAYLLGRHLVERGHRKIALITGPLELNVGRERVYGFEQALRESDLTLKKEWLISGDWFSETGYRATLKLLSARERPTAICATNQCICEGVLKALQEKNVSIPEDISVVGFDNSPLADSHIPQITVIDRPSEDMGEVAAELLLEQLRGKRTSPIARRVVLPVTLLERGSVQRLSGTEDGAAEPDPGRRG